MFRKIVMALLFQLVYVLYMLGDWIHLATTHDASLFRHPNFMFWIVMTLLVLFQLGTPIRSPAPHPYLVIGEALKACFVLIYLLEAISAAQNAEDPLGPWSGSTETGEQRHWESRYPNGWHLCVFVLLLLPVVVPSALLVFLI